jgi:hypothetical protein
MADLTPGMRLHDRYQLSEPIGAGGMAQVWLGTDLVLGRPVAIKTLDGRLAQDPQLRAGARREAQAAAKLAHPHITAVHDYGELVFDDGHTVPFLVMELLTGQTLAQEMQRGPMPWEKVATIAGQIASALAAAHAHGVVHQDIKPANVMLTPTGAKILDFGIAAIKGRPGSPDWISGTPAYAPPERLTQALPDPSADVFSLGVLVYEMATGRLPWPIESWEQAASVQRKPPAPLPPSIPGRQILASLSLDAAQRPTAAQLAAEFGEAGGDITSLRPATAQPSPTLIANRGFAAGSAKVPDRATRTYELAPPAPARPPRRSPHLAAGLTLVVLLIALGMVFLAAAFLQSGGGNGGHAIAPTKSPTAAAAAPTPNPNANVAPASISEALILMRRAVDAGANAGEIDRDRVENLRDRINDIAERDRRNRPKDMINKLEDLQKQVADMAEDGDMSPAVAAGLDALIAQAIAQAQRQ